MVFGNATELKGHFESRSISEQGLHIFTVSNIASLLQQGERKKPNSQRWQKTEYKEENIT